jgi:COMPASS component SWD2
MAVGEHTIAAIDSQGLVFAVGTNDQKIRLFGLNGDRAPFCTFQLDQTHNTDWTAIQFTDDGKYMLISTRNEAHLLIDAFDVCPANVA